MLAESWTIADEPEPMEIARGAWLAGWLARPLLVALIATAWRRRSAWYGLVAATTAAVFSGRIWLPGPGQPPGPVRLLEGDLYVRCGLAVLGGVALALVWERPRRQCAVSRPGQSAVPRIAASSPSKSLPHGPQARR
jgi:hypothetical protein